MEDELLEALTTGDIEQVRFLVAAGVDISSPLVGGMYPLNLVLSHGQERIARLLIEAGTDLYRQDSFRIDELCRLPIHYAAAFQCLDSIKLMIQHGVSVESLDLGHATPLHHAATNGHLELVSYLMQSGADINHTSKSGRTALWKAAMNGHMEVVNHLHKHGAKVDVQNVVGSTILFDLIKDGSIGIIRQMLKFGFNIHKMDIVGNTALHAGALSGYTDSVDLLLEHRADIDAINHSGNTALHCAAKQGMSHSALTLLNNGASFHLQNIACQSSLYMAMLHERKRVTVLLHLAGGRLTAKEHALYRIYEANRYIHKKEFYKWACSVFFDPMSLRNRCRVVIRNSMLIRPMLAYDLPLPPILKQFILMEGYSSEVNGL